MATFLDLISVDLILLEICPYLPILSLLNLASTSKQVRHLLHQTRGTYQHLDLSTCKTSSTEIAPIDRGGFSWRAERMDENLTEDDFYSGPLRGIFSRFRQWNVLGHVQTLILDGQTVTADVVHEIICGNEFRVKIMSLAGVQAMNMGKLRQTLTYACRESRPEGTPTLQGLYLFLPSGVPRSDLIARRHASGGRGITNVVGAQLGGEHPSDEKIAPPSEAPHPSYKHLRRCRPALMVADWALTLNKCRDLIAFDQALCRGPRHDPLTGGAPPALVKYILSPSGCKQCGKMPEGFVIAGECPVSAVPLLRPVPTYALSDFVSSFCFRFRHIYR